MFVLMILGGVVCAYLGFILEVLGREVDVNVTVWKIVILVCAGLMVLIGLIEGIRDLIKQIKRWQSRRRLRGRSGGDDIIEILPSRKGAAAGKAAKTKIPPKPAATPPKPAPRTVAKGKKK